MLLCDITSHVCLWFEWRARMEEFRFHWICQGSWRLASVFCFELTELTSYQTNKLKNVVLMSTAHATEEREETIRWGIQQRKPFVILHTHIKKEELPMAGRIYLQRARRWSLGRGRQMAPMWKQQLYVTFATSPTARNISSGYVNRVICFVSHHLPTMKRMTIPFRAAHPLPFQATFGVGHHHRPLLV